MPTLEMYRYLTIASVVACEDEELLDLVWKMLVNEEIRREASYGKH